MTNKPGSELCLTLFKSKKTDNILQYRPISLACGRGDSLVKILRRKLAMVVIKCRRKTVREFEMFSVKALATIYGADQNAENVVQTRQKLLVEMMSHFENYKPNFRYSPGLLSLIDCILETNIVVGDLTKEPNDIHFTKYKFINKTLVRSVYFYSALLSQKPRPIMVFPADNFLSIGMEYAEDTGRFYCSQQARLKFF